MADGKVKTGGEKVVVFGREGCGHCQRAKELLTSLQIPFVDIDVASSLARKNQMVSLSHGARTTPQIFINQKHIGGNAELQKLHKEEKLQGLLKAECKDCVSSWPQEVKDATTGEEAVQQVPKEVREKYQTALQDLDKKLGGNISSLLIMIEMPQHMTVLCTLGEGAEIYKVGAMGDKGAEGSKEKLYCQVALQSGETLFVDDPSQAEGLEENEDYVKYGYGYYIGAYWRAGHLSGTIAVMEKKPNILLREHIPLVEAFRDEFQKSLLSFL